MSVYTPINRAELRQFLPHYALGELLGFTEISDGIENSNYLVTTSSGDTVLTLFEASDIDEIGFALELMAHLCEAGLPCARAIANRDKRFIGQLKDKPATLVSRLAGKSVLNPALTHCQQIGDHLASLHIAGNRLGAQRPNPRGKAWRETIYHRLVPYLPPADKALLDDEMSFQAQQALDALPRGIIHGDLFRDNVLFQHDKLSGLIDFYHSGKDLLLYDLAITVNDWCFDAAGQLQKELLLGLLQSYQAKRPVSDAEKIAWPVLLRRAALRFFMSRLLHHYMPREGIQTQEKDPHVFRYILQYHRENRLEWFA